MNEVWGADAMPLDKASSKAKRSSSKKKAHKSHHFPAHQDSFVPYDPAMPTEMDVDALAADAAAAAAATPAATPTATPAATPGHPLGEDAPEEESQTPSQARACQPKTVVQYVPSPRGDERNEMFLYVFSGVLLLFLLEQFLQIGIHIGARAALSDAE